MTAPAWTRNKTKYKKYRQANGSVNVVHFSPGKPKVTIRVPKSEARNIPAYLQRHFKPSGIKVTKLNNNRVMITNTKTSRSSVMPLKNPTNENINLFINSYFGRRTQNNLTRFLLHGTQRGPVRANFFQNSTNNGRTGSSLTSLNKNGKLRTVYNVSKGKKSIRLGVAKLGAGEQASVYLGYTDKEATHPVSIKVFPFDRAFPSTKQPADAEFLIGKKLHTLCPRHVPNYMSIDRVVEFVPVSNLSRITGPMNKYNQTVIISEYFHGGDFRTWYKKVESQVKEEDLTDIIRQILGTLVIIQNKYPGFRHNDLHTKNVFIDDTGLRPRAAIADFGLARLSNEISNPIVNQGSFLSNGIGPNTDSRYDAHMFLNSLRSSSIVARFPKLLTSLNVVIPEGYRGVNDTYIVNGRLKYGIQYPGLPSTRAMLRMLVPSIKKKNLINAIAARVKKEPVKFTSANLQRVKGLLKPVKKGTDAANIASSALANMPGVTVSKMPLSATNFLKLTPRSRQAYLESRQTKAKKSTTTLKFTKTSKNVTASTRTDPAAFLKLMKKSPSYELNKFFKTPSPKKLSKTPSPKKLSKTPSPSYNLNKLYKTPSPSYNLNKFFKTPLRPAKNILNSYTANKNVSTLTTRNLRKVLMNKGYNSERAKVNAASWAKNWTNRVGSRRANLKLSLGSNGRVRTGLKLLTSLKRDQLVNMARRHGLAHSGKTKAQLINSLWKN
jgi:hypothetical protein